MLDVGFGGGEVVQLEFNSSDVGEGRDIFLILAQHLQILFLRPIQLPG